MGYPTAPADGDHHFESGVRRRYVQADLAWVRAPADLITNEAVTTAAHVADVTDSWDDGSVVLELTTGLSSLSFTGWESTPGIYQHTTVTVVQDAIGGHAFDWKATEGVWRNGSSEIDLSTVAGDSIVRFVASTIDAGANVLLTFEEDAIDLSNTRSVHAATAPVPAATGSVGTPATVVFAHPFDPVTSVHVVSKAPRGERLDTGWWQSNGEGHAAVNIDFDFNVLPGEYEVRIAGEKRDDHPLTVSATAWKNLPFSVSAAGAVEAIINHDGLDSEVEWVWPDGTSDIAANGAIVSHTAASAGPAMLRWRRDVSITGMNLRQSANLNLGVSTGDLPRTMTSLIIDSTSSTMTGNIADLPEDIELVFVNGTSSTLVGSKVHDSIRELHVGSSNSILTVDLRELPAGIEGLRTFSTQSRVTGDLADAPPNLTLLNLSNSPSEVVWTTATGTLPFSRQLELSYLATAPAMTVAQINGLLEDMRVSGATPGAPGSIRLQGPHPDPDATSGGVDGLAAVTALQAAGWTVTT